MFCLLSKDDWAIGQCLRCTWSSLKGKSYFQCFMKFLAPVIMLHITSKTVINISDIVSGRIVFPLYSEITPDDG